MSRMSTPGTPFVDAPETPPAGTDADPTEEETFAPMMRTVSSEGAALAHPKPDLQTTQGAYVGNVERLEEHAERMSVGGSDIGEEIRKLREEQKLSDSRRSSVCSPNDDELVRSASHRSRRASSIVDVNHAARWGGYSPGAYIGSPIASPTSASWSQTSLHRQLSASKASRLGVVTEPGDRTSSTPESAAYPDSPPPLYFDQGDSGSQSSFANELRAIAQDIQQQLDDTEMPLNEQTDELPEISEEAPEAAVEEPSHETSESHDRPPSAASNLTFKQAQQAFKDFDGVHYAPASRDVSGTLDMDAASRRASEVMPQPTATNWTQPPPDANMVFYPAPVPKMLNLPQRLSLRPVAPAQVHRRDKVMSMMIPQIREEAPWDEQEEDVVPELTQRPAPAKDRAEKAKSVGARKSMAALPSHVRASMFFDPPPVHQNVEVKDDSAVVTLDSILEASASAPVGAFTNHPYAGREGAKVYRREPKKDARRSTTSLMTGNPADARASMISLAAIGGGKDPAELKKRKSSFSLLFGRRPNSSHDLLGTDTSYAQLGSGDRPVSFLPSGSPDLGEGLGEAEGRSASMDEQRAALRRSATPGTEFDLLDEENGYAQIPLADEDAEDEEDEEYDPYNVQYAAPTTLLAELQNRKAQQKSRTRTAATAFPNGMHSTLLELDAVEEMERKRRNKKRVALAWEDPDVQAQVEAEVDDDDVPLGLLFTNQNGTLQKATLQDVEANAAVAEADWDRPLGLIERREIEDNEPLSKRRNRLKGVEPQTITKRHTMLPGLSSQNHLGPTRSSQVNLLMTNKGLAPVPTMAAPASDPEEAVENDDDNIPLAQRAQRLKTRNALSMAISDLEGERPPSGEFLGEILSQFGVSEEPTEPREKSPGVPDLSITPDPEEETLGQRRARLQTQKALERPALSRHTSASSGQLLNDARLSATLPGKSPSPVDDRLSQERPKSQLSFSGLRPSRSMADLLAAHPLTANAHTARKVSDEQLSSNLAAGSLLAQNELLQRRNKDRLSTANAFGISGGMQGPLTGYIAEPNLRQASGTFNQGYMAGQQPLPTPPLGVAGHMNQMGVGMGASMPMQGYGAMPYMNPMQMSHMSMGYSPQAQMQMQMQMMQMQQYMGMMGGGGGGGGMPVGGMGSAYASGAQPRPTTYAAYAQQQMGTTGGGLPDLNGIKPEQRDLIDRWRQGVV